MRKRLIGLLVIVSMLLSSAGFTYARPGNGNASNNKFKKEFKHEYKNEFEHRFNIVDNVESSDASDWPVKEFKGRIRINMHNKKMNIKFDVPPVVKAGRTLIPVRAVTQGLGATVDWDGEAGIVTITKDGVSVVIILGSYDITVNGEKVSLDVPAQIINNRTFVPLRFLGQVFKYKVNYNKDTGDIDIDDNDGEEIEEEEETGDIDNNEDEENDEGTVDTDNNDEDEDEEINQGATVIENNNDENGDIEIINEDVENEVLNEGADNTNDDNEDVEEAENHSTTNNEGENQE